MKVLTRLVFCGGGEYGEVMYYHPVLYLVSISGHV